MTALSAEELSDLIGAIYDRSVDPDGWPGTLDRIRLAIGAENAALSLIDLRSNSFALNYLANVSAEWTRNVANWGTDILNAWGGVNMFNALSMSEPFIWSRMVSRRIGGTNAFVDEVTRNGIADSMALVVARDEALVGACGFGRRRSAGPFSAEQIELGRLLLPHLQRAVAISRLLDLTNLRISAFEAALDTLDVPTLFVNERLEVIHANAAAQAELETGTTLRLTQGHVAAVDSRTNGRLKAAVANARDRLDAPPENLDRASDAQSAQLRLLPLPSGSYRATLSPSSAAALIVAGSRRAARLDAAGIVDRLRARFGLTGAEAKVAVEVAKGDGRSAAALRLGISEKTVRTHLSAIFLKLGINRQAQLVAAVEAIASGN